MELEVGVRYLSMTLEVLLLDLLLSSDNIVMIALACRSLPEAKRKLGLMLGTGAAILLRVLLTTVARFVLEIPILKLLGGLALVIIAIKLIRAAETPVEASNEPGEGGTSLWSAVATIVIADLVMSVDNVLGLAAIARGSLFILIIGLIISVPLLMFGSLFVGSLLQKYPVLIRAGGAMLGWFAGDIAVSDPLFANWIAQQAPALSFVVPILAAAYVLAQVAVMRATQASAAALRPVPRIKSTISPATTKKPLLAAATIEPPHAVDRTFDHSESNNDAASVQNPRIMHMLRRLPWPDRADWPIYERWSIGSLGATGLLLFALRPLPALATSLGVVAVLAMTVAPKVHCTMQRKGWSNALAVAVICVALAAIVAVLLLLFAATGWLGPILR
nr:YjbE family putative metal transport protein [Rhodoferax sp.]